MMPIMIAPKNAPEILPRPPIITMTKARQTGRYPMAGWTENIGARKRSPGGGPVAVARAHPRELIQFYIDTLKGPRLRCSAARPAWLAPTLVR